MTMTLARRSASISGVEKSQIAQLSPARGRAIIVMQRRRRRGKIDVERAERVLHRHGPSHDLLFVIADGRNNRLGSTKNRFYQVVLNLSRVLKLVHEKVRVGHLLEMPAYQAKSRFRLDDFIVEARPSCLKCLADRGDRRFGLESLC